MSTKKGASYHIISPALGEKTVKASLEAMAMYWYSSSSSMLEITGAFKQPRRREKAQAKKERRSGGSDGVGFGSKRKDPTWQCIQGCGACCKLDKGPAFATPEEIFDNPSDLKVCFVMPSSCSIKCLLLFFILLFGRFNFGEDDAVVRAPKRRQLNVIYSSSLFRFPSISLIDFELPNCSFIEAW